MERKKMEFVIDHERVLQEQEKRMMRLFHELYEELFLYIEHDTNLREKVRAKHTYRYRTGLPDHFPLPDEEQIYFENWFAFDYMTVTGARIFDLFIRSQQGLLSRHMLELAGVLMLMHLQPVRVHSVDSEMAVLSPAFNDDKRWEVRTHLNQSPLTPGALVFARITQLGATRMIVGPAFTISEEHETEVLEKLISVYDQGDSSFRKYMKEFGIDFRKYAL
ncbi:hypothetical protein [Salisediminibacterium beveridgei]|uniref:Putative nicotinate phosphoribosyltransferase n=1 Tax=Salisediminibacterium beveridgei TaxID=632773 RepID=A0A1D7QT33_9BACI|nr:hypothetical protein [Salisediminibacterium beveridgei]AOM82138.1 putative nicotinate phosphoribosyltransferase [Salisediminibacterium beveridgei]